MAQPAHQTTSAPDASAYGWILLAYAVALLAAAALWLDLPLLVALQQSSVLEQAFIADVIATLVIFGFSTAHQNASFYDAYWSVAPPILLAFFIGAERIGFGAEPIGEAPLFDTRLVVVSLLVGGWAIRLTHNWARGWQGLHHADWRYVDLQEKTGSLWCLVNLLGIHLFPTVLVFVGCIALYVCANPLAAPFNLFDVLALIVGGAALWLENRADNQLRAFRLDPKNSGQTLTSGVWAWCRHPNYLGEIGFWVALYLFACGAAAQGPLAAFDWALWGPVSMLILFVFISIPMIDKRLAGRAGFNEHKAKTYALLPFSHWLKSNS